MRHWKILSTLSIAAVLSGLVRGREFEGGSQTHSDEAHTAWVVESLKEMQTVKPGMRREQLLIVFREEGGLSSGLRRTYVYRACRYFKVDVDFDPVGRSARDRDGRVTVVESPADLIKNISRPYLAFPTLD